MKKVHVITGATILLGIITVLMISHRSAEKLFGSRDEEERERYEHHEGFNEEGEEEDEEETSGMDKQLNMLFLSRAYPDPYYISDKYARAWQQYLQLKNNISTRGSRENVANWTSLGPNTGIGGRILTIAISPTNGNNLFVGSASGGIWKSTNGGTSWSPVTTGFQTLGVSSIVFDPNNANVLYAGTGEVYRMDSTTGTPNPNINGYSIWKARGTFGIGILKSTDGGTTWSQVLVRSTAQMFAIQTIRFDPTNSSIVYACATDGLYKTTDAGANWTKVLNQAYVTDVVVNASNNQQVVAAFGNLNNTVKGVYRSTNGGTSWTNITSGLPASWQGFIKFGYVNTNANTIIASIGVSEAANVLELYRTTDFGLNWGSLNNSTHTQWQYWSAHDVAINPSNTNALVFGGVKWYSYNVSTTTRTALTTGHDDLHDIQFDPSNSNNVYICCDGGVYKSTNGGSTFSKINSGLNATQFYASIGVSASNANVMVGGLQDNGVVLTTNGGTTWSTYANLGSIDGSACAIDPTNDQRILASGDARLVYMSTNQGSTSTQRLAYWGSSGDSRTGFVSPLAISKSNPQIMYVGSDNLHISSNGGTSFSGSALGAGTPTNFIDKIHRPAVTLAISPTNQNKVYVSTCPFAQADNDVDSFFYDRTKGNNVLRTTTGNTPFTSIMGTGSNKLPDRFVNDFAISSNNDDSVYAVVGGFGTTHVYLTADGGANWIARGTGLPDVPFNAILIDPVNPSIIYAGCDFGVYVSPDRGATWTDYNNGFWDATMIMDLQVDANYKIIAATHGKGIFRSDRYSGTLPVTLLSFTGINQAGYNKLEWVTEYETNLRNYELEKSVDGTNFSSIASFTPRNQNGTYTYNYNDPVSTNTGGIYYYRLKSVELDGGFSYSRVVVLQVNGKKDFAVLTNPFSNQLSIGMNLATTGPVTINVYDDKGSLIKKKTFAGLSGPNTFIINDLSVLPGGTYITEAITDRKRFSQKVLKN